MQFYVVGGAVRDVLLGLHPKDIDLVVVGATAQDLLDKGYHQVGADFPVFFDLNDREVALARTERKTGSGYNGFAVDANPTITVEDDLFRRDLTINAMAVKQDDWETFVKTKNTSYVIDPYGGIADLENKKLRHVSEAFAEDPLRVLRVARFAARYDFRIEDETQDLMRKLVTSGELNTLTSERILLEVEKTLTEKYPQLFFITLRDVGALSVVFPDFDPYKLIQVSYSLQSYKLFNLSVKESLSLLLTAVIVPLANIRLPLSNANKELTTNFNTVVSFLKWTAFDEYTIHSNVINLLYALKAFDDLDKLSELLRLVMYVYPQYGEGVYVIYDSARMASKITFASLSDHEKTTLVGREIGDAIKKARISSLCSVL